MTIKDAKTAAEIAAMCPEAWWLIGLSLKTGVVLRPKDMANAAWGRAVRYMESRALAAIDPITGAYKLQGALADQLFGEKKAKPKKEKPVEPEWVSIVKAKGGNPDDILLLLPWEMTHRAADFYRHQLALAYMPKEEGPERTWSEPYKDFKKYVAIVALLWGHMGKYPVMEGVLSIQNQLTFAQIGLSNIKKASSEQIKDIITQLENKADQYKKYTHVGLTINNWLR